MIFNGNCSLSGTMSMWHHEEAYADTQFFDDPPYVPSGGKYRKRKSVFQGSVYTLSGDNEEFFSDASVFTDKSNSGAYKSHLDAQDGRLGAASTAYPRRIPTRSDIQTYVGPCNAVVLIDISALYPHSTEAVTATVQLHWKTRGSGSEGRGITEFERWIEALKQSDWTPTPLQQTPIQEVVSIYYRLPKVYSREVLLFIREQILVEGLRIQNAYFVANLQRFEFVVSSVQLDQFQRRLHSGRMEIAMISSDGSASTDPTLLSKLKLQAPRRSTYKNVMPVNDL